MSRDPREQPSGRAAWIETIAPEQATGLLAKLYQAALARAGKIYHVIRVQSLQPETLRISTMLYREIMFGQQSPLSRAQRELIATAVSRANACEY
jgi:alkylhydroperoxidase family enzyme